MYKCYRFIKTSLEQFKFLLHLLSFTILITHFKFYAFNFSVQSAFVVFNQKDRDQKLKQKNGLFKSHKTK